MLSLAPLPEGTAGLHTVGIKIWLKENSNIQTQQSVQVLVSACEPIKLTASNDHPKNVEYIIGTPKKQISIDHFIIEPKCSKP